MNRRGFLGSILAACAAPAIVRADSLMRIVARDTGIVRVPWEVRYTGVNLNSEWMARAESPVSTDPEDWVARVDVSDADKCDPLAQTTSPYVMSLAEFERKYPGTQAYVYPKGTLPAAMRPSNGIIDLSAARRAAA